MFKVCTKCGLEKPKDEFPWKVKSKGYLKAWCKSCEADRQREWRSTDSGREYVRARDAEREAAGKRKEHHRRKAMRSKYGLEPHDFQELLVSQDFRCAICEETLDVDSGKYAVDHNHVTSEVRGVLCRNCNAAIGLLKDNPKFTDAASVYLRKRGHYG